jgi:hypothetical protein
MVYELGKKAGVNPFSRRSPKLRLGLSSPCRDDLPRWITISDHRGIFLCNSRGNRIRS